MKDIPAPCDSSIKLFFWNIWHYFLVLIAVNTLFVLCCIPVVTIGPAITAMCRVCCQMADGQPQVYPIKEFFSVFRRNFKQSMAAGLLCIGYLALSIYTLLLLNHAGNTNSLLPLILWVAVAVFFMCMVYVFPQIAMMDLTLKQIFNNAIRLMLVRLKDSIAAVLLAGALLLVPMYFWPITLAFHMFFLFSISALISCSFAWPGIRMYLVKEE